VRIIQFEQRDPDLEALVMCALELLVTPFVPFGHLIPMSLNGPNIEGLGKWPVIWL